MVSELTHDRSRLACMGLLGVDVYVSRRPLAKALPSRIMPAVAGAAGSEKQHVLPSPIARGVDGAPQRTAAAALAAASPDSVTPPLARAASGRASAVAALVTDPINTGKTSSVKSVLPRTELPLANELAATNRGLSRAVAFNLVTVTFPSGVIFVSDIRQAPLAPVVESGVLSFLRDVMLAIGRLDASVTVGAEYFQWPLVKKSGVDASEGTARDVLAGLISRKLREAQADTIVLMGKAANTFAYARDADHGSGQFAHHGVRTLQCEPLGKLFATPSKKSELWLILQPLISSC